MNDPRESIEAFRPREKADFSEVALARKAEQVLEAFDGRQPTRSELLNITEELGVELGTAVYLRSLQESGTHGALIRKLRSFDLSRWQKARAGGIEIAIVASNFVQSGRRWGSHADTWRAWARELGFKTDVVETDPRLSVAANAHLIAEYLRQAPNTPRLIVSYGQGSAEMRYVLQRCVSRNHGESVPFELENVLGWISVCGACGGSALSRMANESFWLGAWLRLRMWLAGRNAVTLKETEPGFPLWQKPMPVPKGMAVISVVGVPYRWQVSRFLRVPYEWIGAQWPNDGVVSVYEASAYPGLIVPLGGLDHRAKDTVLEPVLKRLFAVLAVENFEKAQMVEGKPSKEKKKGPDVDPGPLELLTDS
mgnify:CR=1 FL=1